MQCLFGVWLAGSGSFGSNSYWPLDGALSLFITYCSNARGGGQHWPLTFSSNCHLISWSLKLGLLINLENCDHILYVGYKEIFLICNETLECWITLFFCLWVTENNLFIFEWNVKVKCLSVFHKKILLNFVESESVYCSDECVLWYSDIMKIPLFVVTLNIK